MAEVQVRVLYDFEAQPGTGEMSLREGEILTVTRQNVGDGWWEGTNALGEAGLFPAAYTEEVSSAPPSMPPPSLPPEYKAASASSWDAWESNTPANTAPPQPHNTAFKGQQNYDADDWDDDWDDDDDSEGGGAAGGGEANHAHGGSLAHRGHAGTHAPLTDAASMAGTARVAVSEVERVYIDKDSEGVHWRPRSAPLTCAISSPKKESKFHGMKSFIAYTITPSSTNVSVSRRYKHFDWLLERLQHKFPLTPVPPLPEKQISGRFEDDLIEYRMTMLQSWIDRICRHPVLSQCAVFTHFIHAPNDEKAWKAGKRKAESDKLVGNMFYEAIQRPDEPLDLVITENKIEGQSQFFMRLDESVKSLHATCQEQTKKHQLAYKKDFDKIAHAFIKLSRAFDTDPENRAPQLTEALHFVGDTYTKIGVIYEEEPRHDWEPLGNLLYEYRGILEGFPQIIAATKGALSKRKQVVREASEGKADQDTVEPMIRRSDTVAYALQAEVRNFDVERQKDFNLAITKFLTEQISFYQKVADQLRESLEKFQSIRT
ncbi:sorting nexin-18 isoform X2 [Hyalella azteca]|uniref:Sorting nexin-18 isoform X1 n=1 Tax=Hyalella azteca TaxID=294128 RepID=A0A979FUV5_HYAAZ|nr:sorting nexin-18 isoform X1 [Hyalella azteca]XP_047741019.1 sorting nexin-18 isoform X2 [Hyalella azteca]